MPIPKSKSISSGQYQDGYVALKQLPEYYSTIGDRNSVTNSRFQIEIDQIRELCQIQHNHLARFFGIYKSIDLPTSLVTEYGTKGCLQDLQKMESPGTAELDRFFIKWENSNYRSNFAVSGLSIF